MSSKSLQVFWVGALLACAGVVLWWQSNADGRNAVQGGDPAADVVDGAREQSEQRDELRSERLALPGSEEGRTGAAERAENESPTSASAIVRVHFVDEAGTPIQGAQFSVVDPLGPNTLSDAGGNAELVLDDAWFGARTKARFLFEARCTGFATERSSVEWKAGESGWLDEWTLVAGGSVSGAVLDERGVGLAGARVACLDESVSWANWARRPGAALEELWRPGAQAETDHNGSFLLENVPARRLRLVAVAEKRLPTASEAIVVPAGGVVRNVELRMAAAEASMRVAGKVVDPDGRAVPGAPVRFQYTGVTMNSSCDEHGRFELDLGAKTTCDITAFDPQLRFREASADAVEAGTLDVVLQLTRGPEIELVVLDSKEVPIERFRVLVSSARDQLALASFPVAERSGGVFQMGVPGQEFVLEVHSNGWLPARLGPFRPDAAPARLTCRLEPASGVSGRVVANGQAIGGAWVSLHAGVATDTTYNGFLLLSEREPLIWTTSGAGGEFSLSVEERADYYLHAAADGFAMTDIGPLALDPAVQREQDVELGPGGAIEVTLRSTTGKSGAGALVAFSRGDGWAGTQRADPEGRVFLDQLTPGPWQVVLAEETIDPNSGVTQFGSKERGEIPWNCEVFAGEVTRVDLWLEDRGKKNCRLNGKLVVDGRPAEGWMAALFRDRNLLGAPKPFDEPGAFRLSAEEPGPYRLFLTTESVDPTQVVMILDPLELVEGDSFWSLELATGALEGRLAAAPASGEPQLIFHRWQRGDLQCLAPILPDESGAFRCPRVAAGTGRIVRFDPSTPMEQQEPEILGEIDVSAGKTSRFEP